MIRNTYCCFCVVCSLFKISAPTDSINASQTLGDGETIVSNGGIFELGFFSPGSSKDRYLGIWYKNIPVKTVVWVANRRSPINDLSGSLMINSTISLLLLNGTNNVVWSTSSSRIAQDPLLQLLDSGNLVMRDIKDGDADVYLWQSFDYPSDTLLPGMKLGWDLRTHLNRRLSSWKSSDDPSPGELNIGVDLDAYPQVVMRKGSRKYFRGGPWNGLRFSGAPELKKNPVFDFDFISNQEEVYYIYRLLDKSVITRFVLNETTSTRQRYVWVESEMSWTIYSSVPRDYCDTYGLCGANGICIISDSPVCQCLERFKPKSSQSWNSMDWSQGCILKEPLDCRRKHDFIKVSDLKLPDTTHTWASKSMNLKECRVACLRNCSCMAYTNSNISGDGHGCILWFGDLVDIRQLFNSGQDLYIRVPSSNQANRARVRIVVIVVPVALICGLFLLICYLFRQKKRATGESEEAGLNDVVQREDLGLPLLDLATVAHATEAFSVNNKLGEGGFGPVYKGLLVDGQAIAVKRLSISSGQGLDEFKNEVKLIAKLQHRNLVKLLACCIEEDEKILIYEYMPNGSLDSFIFGQSRGSALDFPKRFSILCGIARGLLYLHQDSRLRIIHRDLKASNVLLDDALNPKISDFGIARTFGGDQSQDSTRRIIGTYGYMAPEYAFYGLFSVKSDVFSFGILILEVVSGKRIRGFNHPQNFHSLIGNAWQLWREERPLELIDPLLDNALDHPEVIRCIHVGLLCIQQSPVDRPNMSAVVLMLNGDSNLPQPKEPGFLIDPSPNETCLLSIKNASHSVNDFTITTLEGR
ncbi:hypothetical protein ACS0TY_017076 [Phlomoides rotata]